MRKLGSDFDKLISEISEYFTRSGAKQMAPYMSSSIPKTENEEQVEAVGLPFANREEIKKDIWDN